MSAPTAFALGILVGLVIMFVVVAIFLAGLDARHPGDESTGL